MASDMDVVERLRDMAKLFESPPHVPVDHREHAATIRLVLAEIERLSAEVLSLAAERDGALDHVERLSKESARRGAEIERLSAENVRLAKRAETEAMLRNTFAMGLMEASELLQAAEAGASPQGGFDGPLPCPICGGTRLRSPVSSDIGCYASNCACDTFCSTLEEWNSYVRAFKVFGPSVITSSSDDDFEP